MKKSQKLQKLERKVGVWLDSYLHYTDDEEIKSSRDGVANQIVEALASNISRKEIANSKVKLGYMPELNEEQISGCPCCYTNTFRLALSGSNGEILNTVDVSCHTVLEEFSGFSVVDSNLYDEFRARYTDEL